jgi:hypothetical protein
MINRLQSQLKRLYQLPGLDPASGRAFLRLVGADGRVRAMVLGLSRPADWETLSSVWRGVQADLALPAPAIAVNGADAFELWFSLDEPVPLLVASAFLQGLQQRYLANTKPQRLHLRPTRNDETSSQTPLIPAAQGDSGNWSAFVAPDLAAVFGDEPLLDLPPGVEAQADLLSRLVSIKPDAFEAAMEQLDPPKPASEAAAQAGLASGFEWQTSQVSTENHGPELAGAPQDPRQFLLHVMNNPSVPLALRIEAAKALL